MKVRLDNLPLTEAVDPPLTSVHVPKFAMGYLAVERLIQLADHSKQPIVKTAVDIRIIERKSVLIRHSIQN